MHIPVVWVLGGPCSGKTTICDRIATRYNFTHLDKRIMVENEIASGSNKGRLFETIIKEGREVSSASLLCLFEKSMRLQVQETCGFIINGYPFEKEHGIIFERKITPADMIIYLKCSDDVMIERMIARENIGVEKQFDVKESFKEEIENFKETIKPLLDHFHGKTLTLNGNRCEDEILKELGRCLECLIRKKAEQPDCE